jgi:broad specificity phosphatase PhoE
MKIYLTRHGETQWNTQGRMQGWKNSDLTEKGIDNAKKLGASLKDINFDYIYSSPLGRAIETANCIKGNKDTQIILKDSLKEMGFGLWEGMEHLKVKELYPVQLSNFWNKPNLYEPIDGESFEEVLFRTRETLKELINLDSYENILVVSHTVFIKAVYAILKDYSLQEFWNPPFMNDTCLTVLEVENKEIRIILEADISHLD